MTLSYIVNIYKTERYKINVQLKGTDYGAWVVFSNYLDYFENYLAHYSTLKNMNELVEHAVKGIFVYKEKEYTHQHQKLWRDAGGNDRGIKPEVSKLVIETIMENVDELNEAIESGDFDVLYDFIKKNKTNKFGGLEIYDTTLRIGAKFNIVPKNVYLHGSTLIGLRTLENKRLVEEDLHNKKTVSLKELPEELKGMSPIHIEDFLNLKRMDFMKI